MKKKKYYERINKFDLTNKFENSMHLVHKKINKNHRLEIERDHN